MADPRRGLEPRGGGEGGGDGWVDEDRGKR